MRARWTSRSIKLCFSGRGIDGGDEETIRGAHGRRDRRGLFAHRGADGGRRESRSSARKKSDRSECRCPTFAFDIVDADDGTKALPSGEVGEIVLERAAANARAIGNAPRKRGEMLRTKTNDGHRALYTGDLGYLDDDGYLFIVDRKKDLIKTSGYQVWPREIEEVICLASGGRRGRRHRSA